MSRGFLLYRSREASYKSTSEFPSRSEKESSQLGSFEPSWWKGGENSFSKEALKVMLYAEVVLWHNAGFEWKDKVTWRSVIHPNHVLVNGGTAWAFTQLSASLLWFKLCAQNNRIYHFSYLFKNFCTCFADAENLQGIEMYESEKN